MSATPYTWTATLPDGEEVTGTTSLDPSLIDFHPTRMPPGRVVETALEDVVRALAQHIEPDLPAPRFARKEFVRDTDGRITGALELPPDPSRYMTARAIAEGIVERAKPELLARLEDALEAELEGRGGRKVQDADTNTPSHLIPGPSVDSPTRFPDLEARSDG